MKFDIGRQEAEALVALLEEKEQPWPLDRLAKDLREAFGMVTKEREEEYKAQKLANKSFYQI